MILLSTTTETLNLDTVTAGTLDYTVYYADHTPTTFTANSVQGSVSAIGTTRILTAPAAGSQRQVKTVIVTNRDITPSAQTIFLKKVSVGTDYYLSPNTPLGPGESLLYSDNRGFEVLNRLEQPKQHTMIVAPVGKIQPHRGYSSVGTTRTLANTQGWIMYAGKAPRSGITQVTVRYRVTTAIVAGIYAEIGIYVGSTALDGINQGGGSAGGPQLLCVGWTTWLTNAGTIGNYSSTINVGYPGIQEGEDVFINFINMFTTSGAALRANVGDDVYVGMGGPTSSAIERRPSVDVGWGVLSHIPVNSLLPAPYFSIQWN